MKLPQRLRGHCSEAGETLIEVLMSSVLMAIVVVAVVGGFATIMLGSRVSREQADANGYLTSGMERIKSSDFARWKCTDSGSAVTKYNTEAANVAIPSGWALTTTSVQYQYIDSSSGSPAVKFGDNTHCSESTPLQLVAMKVTSADKRVTSSLSFVKGDN